MSKLNNFDVSVFGIKQKDRQKIFLKKINDLTKFHFKHSSEYKILINKTIDKKILAKKMELVPFLPVRLFKEFEFQSTHKDQIIKVMKSSGTGNSGLSKIFLDKETSSNQMKALAKIVSNFIGSKRKPMLIIDKKSVISNRHEFSARTAGVLGFSIFGREVDFALNEDMSINIQGLKKFLNKHKDEEIIIFGFTYIIWEKFLNELKNLKTNFNLLNATIIHGGGWKKLEQISVSNHEFKKKIFDILNISKVYNYYGMVEQTGSIFMECDYGYLHTSIYSDIIIRDPLNFEIKGIRKQGLIQLLSVIPKSYPGHSILSEDIGEIYGCDDCKCGRNGNYFKVIGRIAQAEIRGCSDTYTP